MLTASLMKNYINFFRQIKGQIKVKLDRGNTRSDCKLVLFFKGMFFLTYMDKKIYYLQYFLCSDLEQMGNLEIHPGVHRMAHRHPPIRLKEKKYY